jgi:hypothetical protein
MPYFGVELHFGRLERIVLGDYDVDLEFSARVRSVGLHIWLVYQFDLLVKNESFKRIKIQLIW